MTLRELEATFLRLTQNGWMEVGNLASAQGVVLLCPGCFVKNGGSIGTHLLIAFFRDRNVPDNALPGPGRWIASGTSLDDLTLEPSVCIDCWHGFIRAGKSVAA